MAPGIQLLCNDDFANFVEKEREREKEKERERERECERD